MHRADYVQACVREAWPRWLDCVGSRVVGYAVGRGCDDSCIQIMLPAPPIVWARIAMSLEAPLDCQSLTVEVPLFRPHLPSARVLWCGLTAIMRDALDQQGWPPGVNEWSLIDFPAVLERPITLPSPEEVIVDDLGWPAAAEGLEMIRARYSDRVETVRGLAGTIATLVVELTYGQAPRLGRDPFDDLDPAALRIQAIAATLDSPSPTRSQCSAEDRPEISDAVDELVGRMAVAAAGLTRAFRATGLSATDAAGAFQALGRDLLDDQAERQLEGQRVYEELEPGSTPRRSRVDADDLAGQTLAAETQGHDVEPVVETTPGPKMSFAEWTAKSAKVLEECGHRAPTEEERQHDDDGPTI